MRVLKMDNFEFELLEHLLKINLFLTLERVLE